MATAKKSDTAVKGKAKTAPKGKPTKVQSSPLDIPFGTRLVTARARGDVGNLVRELKADTKIKADAQLKTVQKRYGETAGFDVIATRYALFVKRGSQAGKRSRAAA